MGAGVPQQAGFGQGKDHAADTSPVDRAGTHRAGFSAGVESALSEFSFGQQPGSLATGQHLGMLGRVALGPNCIVARGNDRLTPLIDDQGPNGWRPSFRALRAKSIACLKKAGPARLLVPRLLVPCSSLRFRGKKDAAVQEQPHRIRNVGE
jgi:hypothetical protein